MRTGRGGGSPGAPAAGHAAVVGNSTEGTQGYKCRTALTSSGHLIKGTVTIVNRDCAMFTQLLGGQEGGILGSTCRTIEDNCAR